MPRFNGTPVEETAKPRFKGAPVDAPKPQQFAESYEPGLLERAGNWLKDNNLLPIDRMKREMQSADDLARLAAKGATFNQADRFAGFMTGEGTEAERAKTAVADERQGGAGDVAEVAGAVALPLGAAKQGLTLVGRGAQSIPGATGVLTRMGLMGTEGAGYGAATAAGYGEDPVEGALLGAGFGAGGQVLGDSVGAIVNTLKGQPATRSLDQLRADKNSAYKAVDESGFRFSSQEFRDMAIDALRTAKTMNASPMRHPQTADMFQRIGKLVEGGGAPSLTEVDQLRQVVWRDLGNSTDPAEKEFGRMIVDKIDKMIDGRQEASGLVTQARELNRRYRNAERFDEAMTKAQRRADSTYSGGNLENAQRQNARQILDNPRKSKFLNAEEKEAMETMVAGTRGQNAARKIGKTIHSIPGVGALLSGGGAIGALADPLTGGALPIAALLAGSSFKAASRGMGNQNREIVEALVREGRKPQSAMSPAQIQVLTRLLLGGGVNTAVAP